MSAEPGQNIENHVRHDKLAYGYLIVYSAAAVLAGVGVFVSPVMIGAAVVLLAVGAILAATNARGYGIMVQDRVIRLEMRLRLAEVLDGDMKARIPEFTVKQLIGLRFASDAELPELARKVLEKNIGTATEIKKLVQDWQPDHMRV